MKDVLEMAINAVRGITSGEFSQAERSQAIREAFVKMNGGSTKLSPKTFHRGSELFALVEELIPVIVDEGFKDDDELLKLIEYKNIKDGDKNEFYTDGKVYFVVADAAAGIKGVRRQRLDNSQSVAVTTTMKIVRVYEELGRLLAGRITFDKFVDAVAEGFKQKIYADAQAAIDNISTTTIGLDADLVVSGTYSEQSLLDLIEKVEAATGKTATIYGTKSALRKVSTAVVSDKAKDDIYNFGYYGKFNGTAMVALRQSYKPGTKEFNLKSNKLYIIAGDSQPIKVVNEGEGIMLDQEATVNNDLTREYVYGQGYGVGTIVSEQLGVYTIA
jgi:hypothetical protein